MNKNQQKKIIAIEILIFIGWIGLTIVLQNTLVGHWSRDEFAMYWEKTAAKTIDGHYFRAMWGVRFLLIGFWLVTYNILTYLIYISIRLIIWAIKTLKLKND